MAGWFIGLWLLVLAVAIMSKSLVANIALIFVCVLGYREALAMSDADLVRWGVAGVFALVIAFAAMQMVTTVDKV